MNCDGETLYFRTRMKRRAADFLKALDEGKLTESQEAHRFTIVYSTLSRDEKVIYMSYFAYACKTEGKNGISRLISALCVNCLISIPEYSRLNHLDVYLV